MIPLREPIQKIVPEALARTVAVAQLLTPYYHLVSICTAVLWGKNNSPMSTKLESGHKVRRMPERQHRILAKGDRPEGIRA